MASYNKMPTTDPSFSFDDKGFSGIASDMDFQSFMLMSQTQDYSDLVALLKPSSDDLNQYGIMAEDFILQCSYDHGNCSYL